MSSQKPNGDLGAHILDNDVSDSEQVSPTLPKQTKDIKVGASEIVRQQVASKTAIGFLQNSGSGVTSRVSNSPPQQHTFIGHHVYISGPNSP